MGFIIDYDVLYKELENLNIDIVEYEFTTCNAMTVYLNGKYTIGVDKSKTRWMKYWLIEHELEHIKNGTLYHMNDDKFIINKNERITNDAVVTKLGLVLPVVEALLEGKEHWEICLEFEMPNEVLECVIDYINRKELMSVKNCVELLCIKNGYDAKMLALKLGCTESEAIDIINQNAIIKYDYIKRLCQIFDVEANVLLCL